MSREDKRAQARRERAAEQPSAAPVGDDGPLVRERTSPPQFMREVRSELRKVAWPSRREVATYTVTVLVVTAVLTTLVWGMDYVLRQAATQFL
jgi:preprotein translocase subunit SecE